MSSLRFVVIIGSVREGRVGDRVLKLFMDNAGKKFVQNGYSFEVIDARDVELPVLKKPVHFYKEKSQIPETLQRLHDIIERADGYFLMSAEYNRVPCPGLVNLMDHFPIKSYAYKPSGIIAYSMGPQGGAFAAVGLRPLIAELNMVSVKNMVLIPQAHQTITEDGATENERLKGSMDKLVQQVAWWAQACKVKRENDGIPDL